MTAGLAYCSAMRVVSLEALAALSAILGLEACVAPTVSADGGAESDAALRDASDERAIDVVQSDAARARDAAVVDATGREASSETSDARSVDPGTCGAAVRACFCGCGTSASCQQGCIAGDEDCGFCVLDAASMCCPAESMALFDCIDRTGCETPACLSAMCAAEQNTFNACTTRRQSTDAACIARFRACLGLDFPAVVCE